MAHPKHQQVRERFGRRCGYCGVSETDTGGELSVDHFVPVTAGGDESDDNLIYACFRCNLYKKDYFARGNDLAEVLGFSWTVQFLIFKEQRRTVLCPKRV